MSGLGPVPTQPPESMTRGLESLHPRLSPGAYCIVDRYYVGKGCDQAISGYHARHGVTTEIIDLDCTSAMWRER